MKEKYKNKSIKFWDKHSELWEKMVYDKENMFLRFPTSGQREDITLREILNRTKSKSVSILDIGCANGELVRKFIKKGFKNIKGIDNSNEMIKKAKEELQNDFPNKDPDSVFFYCDVDKGFDNYEKFDFITALGLVEYVIDRERFFRNVSELLNETGIAFIESRNKLFNLFSANKYTTNSDLEKLISELEEISKFSPVNKNEEIAKIVAETYINIGRELKSFDYEKKYENYNQVDDKFPFELPQMSPGEIASICERNGLKLDNIIYYHPHPFIPRYESNLKRLFNKMALLMEPLGYTPLGATICSSYVAIISREE